MERYNFNKKGFSVIEAIVASSVFALIVTTVVGVYIQSSQGEQIAGEKNRAVLLAEEALEAGRALRDADFDNLIDGTHGLATTNNTWVLAGSADTIGNFSRNLAIATIDENTKELTATVSWQSRQVAQSMVQLVTYLTNWQEVAEVDSNIFRVEEYYIAEGTYTEESYNLTVNNDLSENYFVIANGSDGAANNGGTRGPDENYIALRGDPFGTGDLSTTADATTLLFEREGDVNGWVGVITVVECLVECETDGFLLTSVDDVVHSGSSEGDVDTAGSAWADSDQVVLIGGFNGAGCTVDESNSAQHSSCHVRLWPSSTDSINWSRDDGGGALQSARSTVMAVEWGSEWEVQHAVVSGNNGGNGANSTGEYDVGTINSVARDTTWVWGTGWTTDSGIGDGAEGTLITLGDGVNQNTDETSVAVGQEYGENKTFDIYTMTHPLLAVDYRFKSDGNANDLTYDVTVDEALTSTARMALIYNGQSGTGSAYPRPIFSARYINNDTIRAERRRSGQAWPAWIQGIDFSAIVPSGGGVTDTEPPVLTVIGNDPAEVEVGASYSDLGVSVTDNVNSGLGYSVAVDGVSVSSVNIDTSSPGSYTITYTATDSAGNEGTTTRIVNVVGVPTQADTVSMDASGAYIVSAGGQRTVRGIFIENTGADPVTIATVTPTWTSANREILWLYIDDITRWSLLGTGSPSGIQESGTELNITDTVLTTSTPVELEMLFDGNMNNEILGVVIQFTDGSEVSFTGVTL